MRQCLVISFQALAGDDQVAQGGFIRVIGKDIEVPVDGLTGQVHLKVPVGKQTFLFVV